MSFHLSPELDKNKVFLVNRSELEGRLDAIFYHPKYIANENAIKRSKWGYEKVGHIANRITDGPFGSDLKVEEYKSEGNPLLRVSNIRTGEVEGDLVYISDEKQQQLKRSKVYPNDVLLTKAGAIPGYSAVFPKSLKEGNITSHLVTITCRQGIDPHYLSHFFRSEIGQLQIYRWGNKSTRPELNTGEVKNILVTTPPKHIQTRILENLNAAYAAKKQKETEAQRLHATIDDVLLDKLGIPRQPETPNTLESRIFQCKFSKVTGGRIDPNYQLKIDYFMAHKGNFPLVLLNDIIESPPQYGAAEEAIEGDPACDCRYIRITDIDEYGSLKKDTWKTARIIDKKYLLNLDDLLFARSGSVGRCYIHKKTDCPSVFAGYLIRFVIKRGIALPDYIFHYCNSSLYKLWVSAIHRPAVQSNINAEEYKSLPIFLPPVEIQEKIVSLIETIHLQVEQLQQQARADLEKAKRNVEVLILGKEGAE